ncbi:MAG: T9SS type A sorting domain-containing protein, partial [Bacteroidales bacterium]|nr:T9SS type A sorting domain-containing protein [Bacteroidales bacterium]
IAVLSAHAWMPYIFRQWDDGEMENPRRVVVTQDTVFTALFTDPVGIATADSGLVRLKPNPASGSVVAMSSYGIERVEVYDARGIRVYEQAMSGTVASFDVSGWVKGAYALMVYTPAGIATKRLVVE